MKKSNKRKFDFKISVLETKEDSLEFRVDGEFVPASRPRFSKFGSYIAEPYKSFKKQFFISVNDSLKNYSKNFIGKPLSIDISFFKKLPTSISKANRKEALENGCTKRPDLDNYFKAVLDSLENIIFTDDSHVVELSGRKLYTEEENNIVIKIKIFKLKGTRIDGKSK